MEEAIEYFKQAVGAAVMSPAARHLLKVDENCEQVSEENSEIFHFVTAKILYITKRDRPHLEPTVAYLCTRVSCSNGDNWKKLETAMKYIEGTINNVRIIKESSLKDLYTSVDTTYTVHNDMCSHTGGAMLLGWGIFYCKPTK